MILVGSCVLTASVLMAEPPVVHEDYCEAYRIAEEQERMLLIDFESGVDLESLDRRWLATHIVCRPPADFEMDGRRLRDSAAFAALDGQRGVAIVDFSHWQHRGHTVSVLPSDKANRSNVDALLALPEGTLTQRTLIWAFRVHPERPRSVYGLPAPDLMQHAERHSLVQARTNNQHHAGNNPGRSEIVAESWPWNKNIVVAAIDIVDAWRHSSGHWSAASRQWGEYGYDMKTNGNKWFATGTFR